MSIFLHKYCINFLNNFRVQKIYMIFSGFLSVWRRPHRRCYSRQSSPGPTRRHCLRCHTSRRPAQGDRTTVPWEISNLLGGPSTLLHEKLLNISAVPTVRSSVCVSTQQNRLWSTLWSHCGWGEYVPSSEVRSLIYQSLLIWLLYYQYVCLLPLAPY